MKTVAVSATTTEPRVNRGRQPAVSATAASRRRDSHQRMAGSTKVTLAMATAHLQRSGCHMITVAATSAGDMKRSAIVKAAARPPANRRCNDDDGDANWLHAAHRDG